MNALKSGIIKAIKPWWLMAGVVLVVTLLVSAATGDIDLGSNGNWLQFRGDRALTGRSTLKGNIRTPKVLWSHYVGARETLATVQFRADGASRFALPGEDMSQGNGPDIYRDWGVKGPYVDLDGNGKFEFIGAGPHFKVGKFLPELSSGWQKVDFSNDVSVNPGFGRLSIREGGRWKEVCETGKMANPFGNNAIVGDFDNDGKLEVAASPISEVFVFDLATGKTKARCVWKREGMESGRGYGWFGAEDLNADGKKELILIGDFQEHIEVFTWEGEKLALAWQRVIEPNVTARKTLLRLIMNPVSDVDGDGKPEIVVSVYNESGDGHWHTLVFEGMTGKVMVDLQDQCVAGLMDVDGDGASEILCTQTHGRLVPDRGKLTAFGYKGGKLRAVWETDDSAFVTVQLQSLPLNVNSSAGTATLALLTGALSPGSRPAFFTRKLTDARSGETELAAWGCAAGKRVRRVGWVAGPHLEALAVKPDSGLLVRARVPGDTEAALRSSSARITALASMRTGIPTAPVLVAKPSPKSAPAVVVQGDCEDLVAFQPDEGKPAAKTLWRSLGRGMHSGWPLPGSECAFGGVMIGDLDGGGKLYTVFATKGRHGQARISVVDFSGVEKWHADFDDYPGDPPSGNGPGLNFWYVGHFTSKDRCDVLVNVRPSQDNTLILLDGRTGTEIWRRSEVHVKKDRTAGCGGMWMSISDYDGDGLDDIVSAYYATVSVFKGTNGDLLLLRDTAPGGIVDLPAGNPWPPGSYPTMASFDGNGSKQILFWSSLCRARMLLSHDGKVVWLDPVTNGPINGMMAGIGDIDGDGKIEFIAAGDRSGPEADDQQAVCYDAVSGSVKWRLPLGCRPSSVMSPATADIDGDGRDECIFPIGGTLYCVGADKNGTSGEIRWKLDFPSKLGPPAIADVDGSGWAQVVVSCADGNVYGVGAR